MDLRKTACRLAREAIVSVLPDTLIRENITFRDNTLYVLGTPFVLGNGEKIHVFGSGKASFEMAKAMHAILGDHCAGGIVVSNYLPEEEIPRFQVMEASHPVPDKRSVAAADKLLDGLSSLSEHDFFVYLLSGGSSALLEKPYGPLTLDEIKEVNRLLLAHNVPISEVNAVRKHLSAVKGGRLGAATKARGVVLVVSDVIGDGLQTIGSGPLYCDSTTFDEAKNILLRNNIWHNLPDSVRRLIDRGIEGEIPETPKEPNPAIPHVVLGSNKQALMAAQSKAESFGINSYIMTSRLEGEAKEAAKVLVAIAKECAVSQGPFRTPLCLLFGGETTVQVRGSGRGGRNQELALSALKEIGDTHDILLISVGSDGIDGNSNAAGALADAYGFEKARAHGLDIHQHLADNNSYQFFSTIDDLIFTGPTGTNVMDLIFLLINEEGGK